MISRASATFPQRLGKRLASWLFDAYMRDLIEHYVRNERDQWAERFEQERLRYRQIEAHRDALLALMVEAESLNVKPMWVPTPGRRAND